MDAGLLKPLGRVLRETREEAGVLQVDVAMRARVHRSVVSRLESGKRWPEAGPDRLVSAYADECEVEWLKLWDQAISEARSG